MTGGRGAGHIGLYLPSLAVGGAERVMITLANGFAEAGRRVTLILDRAEGGLAPLIAPTVSVVPLGVRRTTQAGPVLARAVAEAAPDVVLSALPHNNLVALASLRGTPVVITEHLMLDRELMDRRRLERLALRLAIRLLYRRAAGRIAVSPDAAVAMAAVAGLPRGAVSVVGNPVIPALPQALPSAPHPWLSEQPGPLVFAGRMVASKDVATLLAALALLPQERLILLGDGPERAALEAQAAALGLSARVAFVGTVPGTDAWFARAGAVVLPSRHEGFGNVLVEAMAWGTPVVSTDAPGGPRYILEDGDLGPLAPVGDPAGLAAAIQTCRADPVPADRLRARAAEFTWSTVTQRYLERLDRAATGHSAKHLSA
ncbi:MAG: glycosyltransferase [Alphaproteobacteria bacterium]|nr:glycosyltransferase [Alphaproteobacteria bacterium]